MGVVAGLAGAAAAASLGNTISGGQLFGGGGGGGGQGGYYGNAGTPPTYIPTNQPGADAAYWNITQSMIPAGSNIANYISSSAPGITQNLLQNPYGPRAVSGAQQASQYGWDTLAPMQQSGAATLQGLGNTAAQYAPQILQTGFDPQSALYNRTQQQVQDQTNAINAMYGLSSSPYGAGVAGQTLANFNIDWQNQQLQRQINAAQGYGGLETAAGRGYSGASDLGGAAQSTLATGGALPYSAYQNVYGNQLSNLGTLGQLGQSAFGLDQNTLNALAAYMRLGQSASGQAITGGAQAFNQQQQLGQQFGQNLQALGGPLSSLFGSGGGGGGGSQFMGYGPSGFSPMMGDFASQFSPALGGSAGDLTFAGM